MEGDGETARREGFQGETVREFHLERGTVFLADKPRKEQVRRRRAVRNPAVSWESEQ